MRQVKVEEYVPHDEMHVQRRQIDASEHAEHVDRYQAGRVRIEAMIEQFAERSAGAGATRLFAIDAVCIWGEEGDYLVFGVVS